MTNPLPDYTALVDTAVGAYWDVRRSQAARSQAQEGVLNPGLRSEVTGGRHFDALHALLVRVFIDAGIPPHLIDVKKRPVAGYFRRSKSWDVVVMVADRVAGIIELKSMGPHAPGKNFNNRLTRRSVKPSTSGPQSSAESSTPHSAPGSATSCCSKTTPRSQHR